MLWIICILLGVAIGQHLKVTPSPELTAAIARYWPPAEQAAIVTAQTAVRTAAKAIKSATKTKVKAAPIQIFEITEGGETA
jgi:hypothetical protein